MYPEKPEVVVIENPYTYSRHVDAPAGEQN
jgi:hypothetical protein